VRGRFGRAALLLLALAPGCRQDDAGGKSGARLEVRWAGADSARFGAPATAEWCDSLDLLEIRAAAGDTGIELALYRRGGIVPGRYTIHRPEVAASTRPGAAVGLRLFSQTAVRGYQGTEGEVAVRREPDGALAGDFTARASAVAGGGRLKLTGSFEGLRPRPTSHRGCYAPPPPDTSAGVH
jgi:hypothetical protein